MDNIINEKNERLVRYKQYTNIEFIQSLVKNDEYSLDEMQDGLMQKIKNNEFNRIVFTGMGCSAIVSNMIRGFFAEIKHPIQIHVINDYDFQLLLDNKILSDPQTLIIISSYSGHSKEPIIAYYNCKQLNENILFLTSGGKLAEIAKKDGISIIRWKISNPDREYPLFHAPQYFVIILDFMAEMGILSSNYKQELKDTMEYLQNYVTPSLKRHASKIAEKLRNMDITLLATPLWHGSLLKLVKMHLNEIAMAPAHRNHFHEFCHSEVAVFSHPKQEHGVIIFRDNNEDSYTADKMNNLINLLSKDTSENKNIKVVVLDLDQSDFFKKMFSTLLFMHFVTYELGLFYNTPSRELISTAAGNPWYNQNTIIKERKKKTNLVAKTINHSICFIA